ncbi:choice-of-anchor G family protein [Myceligenerans salitolerans]|uniref:Choice-of-anchor G family protein n=1 Tax=Myceligenerans salitolerans TaxID=1230528 RepID=A0ABS3I6R5_9MICO|nr:choice-of-anchor G family protein [Myceligenerans salitolerans]MBO0608649.1 choice-of-anchor G family protein [Myceligenerans salitolerans]
MSVPAQAALDTYPDDPAEAGASVLNSELMEQELLGAATSVAGWDTDPGPNTENLDVDLLGSQLLSLGDIAIPVDQFMDLGQLGALASTSEASSPTDARAATGVIGPDGGVTIDGTAEGDWGTTTLDLLALADTAGVGGITDLAVDQLDLQLGALGSEVIAEDGVFLDPDGGVTGPGQYVLGDASLLMHSPLIEDAAAQIYDLGALVDTTAEDLVNQVFDVTALVGALDLPGVPTPECSVDSNMQETIVNAVVGEPLTSANQLVTIDFSTGQAEIHLEHLVEGNDPWAGGDDAGMNGLAPNYEVIDDQTYPQIAEGVHELMEEAVQIMTTAIEESLSAVSISCQFLGTGPLPGDVFDVSWTVNLADAASGDFPPVEQNCSGTAAVTCQLLATTINTSGALLTPIFATVYDFLISDEGAQVFELLITDIKTGLVTETIGTALSPVFDVITQFISLQINHQETATCTTDTGEEALASLEVSALWLGLMQGELGSIGLGNSGVRIDACGLAAIEPVITADPTEFPAGECTVVSGEGYTPDSTVTVQLTDADGNPVGDPITAETDADGAFTIDLCTTPDTPPGDYTIIGTDDETGTPAETPVVIQPVDAITPSITVDPTVVAPGECTVVSGEGYTPNSTVTVQLTDADGNPVGDPVTAETDETGAFTVDLCVPEDAEPGDYTVIGTDDETGTPAETPLTVTPVDAITPTITVDPTEVAPGECTVVSGEGYTPNSTVTVQLTDADGNPIGDPVTAETDDTGAFTVDLCVPEDTAPGEYTVIGTDDETGTPAETPLTVTPAPVEPTIAVDPTEVAPGECTVVTGEGYTPDSTVTIQLTDADGNPVGDPVTAPTDETGAFTADLCVPEDAEPGDYTVVGTDDTTGTPAEAPLTVTPVDGITPSISVDPTVVDPGECTVVSGEGYTPNSTVTVQLTDADGNPVGDPVTAETDETGAFTVDLCVPEDAEPGDYTVIGTDDETGTPAETPLTVNPEGDISPTIVADPDVVAPGDTTDIIGDGYTPDSTVTIQLVDPDGNPVGDPVTAATDETGSFVLPAVIMEETEPGEYTVIGTDDTTGIAADTPLTVTPVDGIDPTLSVDPSEVAAGESTEVTGEGYTPDSTVTVQLVDADGNPVGDPVEDVPTDENGMFTVSLTVPEDAEPGDHTVVGTDDTTGTPAEAPLTVTDGDGGSGDVDPAITADPVEVAPGDSTEITGTGYTPNGMVTLYLMDQDGNVLGEPEPFEAEDDGTFVMPLNVPADAETGPYTVVGVDETTGLEATTMIYVTPGDGGGDVCSDPALFATTEVVTVGDDVLVTGMGFEAGAEVEVQLYGPDGEPLGDPVMVTVNEQCGFQVTITVPEGSDPGLHEIIATPEDGGDGASVPIAVCGPEGVARALDAWFEHGTVEPGDSQTFYASGFEPGEVVVGLIHSSPIALQGTAADEEGVVSWTFTVPADFAAGPHVGIATSTVHGDHAIAGFDVVVHDDNGNGDGNGDCECDDGDGDGNGSGDDGNGAGDGNGTDGNGTSGNGTSGSGNGGGHLAATGSDASMLAALSFLLLAAGAVLVRRRQVMSRR